MYLVAGMGKISMILEKTLLYSRLRVNIFKQTGVHMWAKLAFGWLV